MDIESLKTEAGEWLNSSSVQYDMQCNECEGRLTFQVQQPDCSLSFYINVPEKENSWTVWSDSDTVLPHLQDIHEFCESNRTKSMTEILERTGKVINTLLETTGDEDDDDDDDGDDTYYQSEDVDVERDVDLEAINERENGEEEEEAACYFGSKASPAAFQRLKKDLKNMQKASTKSFGLEGRPRGENLFVWDVKLTNIPFDIRLGKDLQEFARKHNKEPVLHLEMQFPMDYPMSPPFVRVVRPRFKFLTGHVTIGGSICMEMLTKSGWRPTNDIESILVQIRSEILSDPNARLDTNPDNAYGETEARDAFDRMVSRYGWNK